MDLVSFSVSNYRSITSASRLPISNYTILIGPNNEGKSNLLNALHTGMSLIAVNARTPAQPGLLPRRITHGFYEWDQDFPIGLQETKPRGQSIFRLEFQLNGDEIDEFRREVQSNLNGTLPIELRIGPDHNPTFKVLKKGPGGAALTKKSSIIAKFIGSRVEFNYIPAIRTTEATSDVVSQMVAKRLRTLLANDDYQAALDKVNELQAPILQELSTELTGTLNQFLPDVRSIKIELSQRSRTGYYRTPCEIIIDDGTPTLLERKGDGIKSLAAISLLYQSETTTAATIIALEEPESHLHPDAIHRLRKIVSELAHKSQIVITTHNPLFVDRVDLKSNILVSNSKASPAKSLEEIRNLLGVRASDNLRHARLVLVVEGQTDRDSLVSIFRDRSAVLAKHLANNELAIEHLAGASKLTYKLGELHSSLCLSHVFVDYDNDGRTAVECAQTAGLVADRDCQFAICKGLKNSELEDCVSWKVYADDLNKQFGVDIDCSTFRRGTDKWSERLRNTFLENGRAWNKAVQARAKASVSAAVIADPAGSIIDDKAPCIDALISNLVQKVNDIDEAA